MAELPKSELPQDPEYWDTLAAKARQDAAGPLAGYVSAQDVWYGVLAQGAPWLVAASAAATLVLWLALPVPEPSFALVHIERALDPSEVPGTFIGGPQPPTVDALLVQFPPAADDAVLDEPLPDRAVRQ